MSKLIVLMGLPGSGKSTYAKEYMEKNLKGYRKSRNDVSLIDIDAIKHDEYSEYEETEEILTRWFNKRASETIIDGLFLTNNDVIKIINCLNTNDLIIEIHYWNPDIEKCLYNDTGRRRIPSTNTILNAKMEELDVELLKDSTKVKNIHIFKHDITKKPFWKCKADEFDVFIDDIHYLYSEKWSLGGTYGNCWDNSLTPVASSIPPESFKEFDELLEKICPTITFLQYKNIYRECTDIQETRHSDYYGGSITYAYYRCNLEKLFDILKEKGLIK